MLGRILEKHKYEGKDVIQLSDQNFYMRKAGGELPNVERRPYVEVYKVEEQICMLYLANHSYTTIEPIQIPENKLAALREAANKAADTAE